MKDKPIRPDETLLDILAAHPGAEAAIRSFDEAAGVCLCCEALFDTVDQVAARFNLDPDEFFSAIQKAAMDKA